MTLSIRCGGTGDWNSAGKVDEEGIGMESGRLWWRSVLSRLSSAYEELWELWLNIRGRREEVDLREGEGGWWCSLSLDSCCWAEAMRVRCMNAAPVLVARRADGRIGGELRHGSGNGGDSHQAGGAAGVGEMKEPPGELSLDTAAFRAGW